MSLPGVGQSLASRLKFIAPGVFLAFQTAPRGKLPLSLSRQPLARPTRVGYGIVPGNMNHGVIDIAGNGAAWPIWMSPARSWNPPPPVGHIVQGHRAVGRRE